MLWMMGLILNQKMVPFTNEQQRLCARRRAKFLILQRNALFLQFSIPSVYNEKVMINFSVIFKSWTSILKSVGIIYLIDVGKLYEKVCPEFNNFIFQNSKCFQFCEKLYRFIYYESSLYL